MPARSATVPRTPWAGVRKAAALIGLGRNEEAKAEAQRALTLEPTFTIDRFLKVAGFAPSVFTALSDAWRSARLPAE